MIDFYRSRYFATIMLMVAPHLYSAEIQSAPTAASIWKVVLSLIFIVLFIPACLWLMKRFQLAQMKLGQSEIKIANVQSLGAKEKLMLVEVEGERMLIGVTAHTISHLKSFPANKESFASVMDEVGRESISDLDDKESSQ